MEAHSYEPLYSPLRSLGSTLGRLGKALTGRAFCLALAGLASCQMACSSSGAPDGAGGAVGSGGFPSGGATGSGGVLTTGGSSAGGTTTGGASSGGVASGGAASGGSETGSGGVSDGTPVGDHGQLSVVGAELRDASGSPVQLKGPSSMWLNWEQDGYAESLEGLRFMRDDWGASLVRAAMGITTTDPYDADYFAQPEEALGKVRTIVDHAIELGLYVIIDWHDHDADQHQAEAIEFFTMMAEEYGDTPNVLYEVWNEPLSPTGEGHTWDGVLKPYHEALVAAIRAVDPDNVIILGTPNWSQHVDSAAMNPLDPSAPGQTNLVYTLHFYACSHQAELREAGDAAIALGLPLFVTEWGATHADGGTADNPGTCIPEAQAWHDWMNEHTISWAAWKWDNCDDESCYFAEEGPGVDGGWSDQDLHGHGSFVRDRMRE